MFENYSWYSKLPDEKLEVYEPHLRLFFETMYERQIIWKRRFIEKRPRPWTDNRIFQESKFTNVYRELDRNSQWQINNILLDDELDLRNLVWKLMVFRFFNNPETFTFDASGKTVQGDLFKSTDLISATQWRNGIPDYDEYDIKIFERFIRGVRAAGQNPYTTAYLINSQATPGKSRDYCYTQVVIPRLHVEIDDIIHAALYSTKPKELIERLKKLPAVADFIAHEFYQDFTYIPRYTGRKFMPFDQNDYTNVGPGASIGIRLIFPNLKTLKEQKKAIYRLRDMADEKLAEIGREKGEPFPYLGWDRKNRKYEVSGIIPPNQDSSVHYYSGITLHQIEMWLCEFQKYWKMQIGMGKQRSKFVPKTKVK